MADRKRFLSAARTWLIRRAMERPGGPLSLLGRWGIGSGATHSGPVLCQRNKQRGFNWLAAAPGLTANDIASSSLSPVALRAAHMAQVWVV